MMDLKRTWVMLWVLGLVLVGCGEKEVVETKTAVSVLQPTATEIVPTATAEPTVDVTKLPIETPAPTTTPTEGERAAEAAAQQFVPEYYRNLDACYKAIAEGIVTECMYQDGIQVITKSEWEQLFPDTEFYFIRLGAYHPEGEYGAFSMRTKLVAWQDGQKYEADSFDQLLLANNITLTEENYELIAQAFALMTIPEYLAEDVTFNGWEKVDLFDGSTRYNYSLTAWTKLQGLAIEWFFGFEDNFMLAASGGIVRDFDVGDFIIGDEMLSPNYKDYYFRGE